MRIVAVFDPLLLNELKLAREAGVERHEDDAAFFGVGNGRALGYRLAIGKSAACDAAAIDQLAVEAERIAWMNAPDMCTDGAARALGVRTVGEICTSIRIQ